jgi:iron(III) transport system substrate-binding protein
MTWKVSRRDVLKGAGAAALTVYASPIRAAAPAAEAVTPALIEAAKKEGRVVWYTSVDLPLAERVAKAFQAKYPGIAARVERTGAERLFTRINQEYGSNIRNVDVVNSSDAAHLIVWKRNGWLQPYVPRTWPSTIRPSTRTPTASSRASASSCARWATTPTW